MQKYTVLVNLHLAACRPDLDINCFQDGISGETTAAYLKRTQKTLELFHPTVVTSFYGFNDGKWVAYREENGARYEADTRALIKTFRDAGVRIILESPGMAGKALENCKEYNNTLGRLSDIARKVAEDTKVPFESVHDVMTIAQQKMEAREGPAYDLVASDGAHADWQGHMAIAIAFLRSMGLGAKPIAHIEFDPETKTATASEGHRIVSATGDTIVVESRRYPFYFLWDNPGKNFADMSKVAEELGFFDDLDRFLLVVRTKTPGKYEVKWNTVANTYDSEQLTRGINLAKEFHNNPFNLNLYPLWQLSLLKCQIDSNITLDNVYGRTNLLNGAASLSKSILVEDEKGIDLLQLIKADPMKLHALAEKRQREIAAPVNHTITIRKLPGV